MPSSVGCILGHSTQLSTVEPKEVRRRDANHDADEPQHAVAPAIVERGIHVRRKQREPEAGETAQHNGGSHSAGSVSGVRVDDVGLHALQADDGSCGEDGDADVGHHPVKAGLDTPAVPEEADGDEHGADEHGRDAEFGQALFVCPLRLETLVQPVRHLCVDLRPQGVAHAERDVVQPADAE